MADGPTQEQVHEISEAIASGRKIEAIRIYRQATGRDLKAAKEFIEALTEELRQQDPNKYGSAGKGKGCASTAVLCTAAVTTLTAWLIGAL